MIVCGPLDLCDLPVSSDNFGKCYVCATVDESHTIEQRLVQLPSMQVSVSSNSGGVA